MIALKPWDSVDSQTPLVTVVSCFWYSHKSLVVVMPPAVQQMWPEELSLICTSACVCVHMCIYTCMRTHLVCAHAEALRPSVLWRCWLGGRKGIRPVKNWVMGFWHGFLSGARCRLAYGPADATATHYSLASVKSRLVLPFWYRLTRVVPEKGPLNGCVCVCVSF